MCGLIDFAYLDWTISLGTLFKKTYNFVCRNEFRLLCLCNSNSGAKKGRRAKDTEHSGRGSLNRTSMGTTKLWLKAEVSVLKLTEWVNHGKE